jgi:hypothetical protein
MFDVESLRSIMMTCVILHNMIVEDEFDYDAVDEYEPEADTMNNSRTRIYCVHDATKEPVQHDPLERDGRYNERDLQRVMRRKWQVAQKCKQDVNVTPHEVLGFRDPPDYKETNVSNWVAEHYGCGGSGQNLYENVYRAGGPPPTAAAVQSGVTPARVPAVPVTVPVAPPVQQLGTPVKKRPPPPPPPRAETTHLTTTTNVMNRCQKF